ncbi:unnamed protein product [Prorocentrum cordatum]|uniref:Replication termination factor 2 n=1 Tax=Prorocentrum cordatum TaxID=2364126 RepID=A0ABN9RF57_9DINO|nr:unnamed protein product [Polarella glacialis]
MGCQDWREQVLTSAAGSGNQSLHPDVPYFKGLTVSVHTALLDVTADMGPTYFCPCTGEALRRDEWPASAAMKMSILKKKDSKYDVVAIRETGSEGSGS